jgi:hypothetical protein
MFGPHFDGCFPRRRWDRSLLTFIIYLTDDFEGGSTMFYPSRHEVRPVKGMACLFFHGSHPLSPGTHTNTTTTHTTPWVNETLIFFCARSCELTFWYVWCVLGGACAIDRARGDAGDQGAQVCAALGRHVPGAGQVNERRK